MCITNSNKQIDGTQIDCSGTLKVTPALSAAPFFVILSLKYLIKYDIIPPRLKYHDRRFRVWDLQLKREYLW